MPKTSVNPRPGAKQKRKRKKSSAVDSLLAADAAWLNAYQSKNAAATAAFYAPQGAMLAPNRPLLSGKDALRKFIAKSLALQDYDIVWHPKKAAVALSGELGYTTGSYEMSFRPPRGNLFFDKGKYVMIWKKQPNGDWKVLLDISNSDLPASQ